MWKGTTSPCALRRPGAPLSTGAGPACGQVKGSWRLFQAVHTGDTFKEGAGSLWGCRRGTLVREVTVRCPWHSAWHACLHHWSRHIGTPALLVHGDEQRETCLSTPGCSDCLDPRLRITDTVQALVVTSEAMPRVIAPNPRSGHWLWSASLRTHFFSHIPPSSKKNPPFSPPPPKTQS